MSFKKNTILAAFIFTTIFMLKCTSIKPTANKNKKYYTPVKEELSDTQFYFYKNTDTSINFYALFNTYSFLHARLDTGFQFYAVVKINVYLQSITNHHIDSSSKIFYILKNQEKLFTQFSIKSSNDNYLVKIIITDMHKKNSYPYVTELKINNNFTRYNYLVTLKDSLLFRHYVINGNTVKIYHRNKPAQLYVDVFKYNHQPAPPPFSNITPSLNYLPDSSFSLSVTNNQFYLLNVQANRYYHIRTSQNTLDGLTIFSVDSIFPYLKDAHEMLYTSRYIMNKNEFERCHQLNNTIEGKKCIDNFWIQIGGSKERAKEVIKNYYQRVINANKLFTSYKYGWQTDRGMIYIIFGAPEDSQKNINSEKWYYSINGQKNALVFNFRKNENNPFTNTDFILERSDYYKDIWYITVDKIRQGRLSISR